MWVKGELLVAILAKWYKKMKMLTCLLWQIDKSLEML